MLHSAQRNPAFSHENPAFSHRRWTENPAFSHRRWTENPAFSQKNLHLLGACLSIQRSLSEFHRGSCNVCCDYVPSFAPSRMRSTNNLRRLHELYPDPFVLITADKFAAAEIQNLGRDVSLVIDYDGTSCAGQLSQPTSDWLKDCQEQRLYNRLQFQYMELVSRFEQLLNKQRNKQRCHPRLVASPKAIDPPIKAIDPPINANDHYWTTTGNAWTKALPDC